MTTTKNLSITKENLLNSLRLGNGGFSFGKPERLSDNALAVILPILRTTNDVRHYVTFPETDKVDVTDTGRIDKMQVKNLSPDNAFLRSGTLFIGQTQTRALTQSAMLVPGETLLVTVRCVHASHGISGGAKTTYGGVTPLNVDQSCKMSNYTDADQTAYWNSVNANNTTMFRMCASVKGQSSNDVPSDVSVQDAISSFYRDARVVGRPPGSPGMDNLADNFKNFAADFDHILKKAQRLHFQTGLALVNHAGVQTIETFEHPVSWQALHEAAIKRLGPELASTDKTGVFEYKPEAALKAVNEVLALPFTLAPITIRLPQRDEPKIEHYSLDYQTYVGEMTLLDDAVIHMVILKRAA